MGKTLEQIAGLAMYGIAALGIFGTPSVAAQPYNQEAQQQTVKQKVPLPPESQIKLAEKEIREIYRDEYRVSDPAKRKAFGEKLLSYGRDTNDAAQKYVLLRDAANTLSDLLELDTAFEAVKTLGETFDGYKTLEECGKYLTAAQKKARTKDDAGKIAEAYLQLAETAVQEKNYSFATKSAKSAESVGRKAGNVSLVERAGDLVKSIPEMEREYGLYKKAEATLELNNNDPEANTIVGMYKGFVENNWEAALNHLSRGTNGISKIALQELLLKSSNNDDPKAICSVADLWYEHSGKTSNALEKRRFATHALDLYREAQTKATGITKDKIDRRISELEKKVNPTNGTGRGVVDLLRLIDPTKDAVKGVWKKQDAVLISDGTNGSRIELPYAPSDEYDFTIVFETIKKDGEVNQIIAASNKSFVWYMGGWNNTIGGFGLIGGINAHANKTSVKITLDTGHRYESTIKVRKDGVSAYLDGKLMTSWKTNYEDMDIFHEWKLNNPGCIGIGTNNITKFYSINVREITGKGKLLR